MPEVEGNVPLVCLQATQYRGIESSHYVLNRRIITDNKFVNCLKSWWLLFRSTIPVFENKTLRKYTKNLQQDSAISY